MTETRRGGAALSIKSVAGRPIKFVGVGEKMDALEVFYPDRMASRILGMGDVLTLIERAEQALDQKQAEELEKKLRANKFDFEDYLSQMRQMRKMGPIGDILKMIPGLGGAAALKDINIDEKHLAHIEAMILSMTTGERRDPSIINGSRRRRIANGSGRTIQDVNRLLTQFEQMKKMMRGPDQHAARRDAVTGRNGRQARGQQQKCRQQEQEKTAVQFQAAVWTPITYYTQANRPRKEQLCPSKSVCAAWAQRSVRFTGLSSPTAAVPVMAASSRPLGYYNPCVEPAELKIDDTRATYWLGCGAQPTETAEALLKKQGIYEQIAAAKAGTATEAAA